MSSWLIDPKTGDYVMKNGKPVPTENLEVPAYYRVKIVRNGWMYAPDTKYGSDLATLQKKTGNAALNMIDQAIQPMIDDGRALTVDSQFDTTQTPNRNNAAVQVTITDAQGNPQILNLPPLGP